MTTRICSQCFEEFEGRSDAVYCSATCRAAANYAKKKRRVKKSTDNKSLDVPKTVEKVVKSESLKTLETDKKRVNDEYAALLAQYHAQIDEQKRLVREKEDLQKEIIKLEEQQLPNLTRIIAMKGVDIYNTYLNLRAIDELARGGDCLRDYLILEYDYSYTNQTYRYYTECFYREKLQELEKLNADIAQLKEQIRTCIANQNLNSDKMAVMRDSLRVLQQKLLV